jgi:hypothetical protein
MLRRLVFFNLLLVGVIIAGILKLRHTTIAFSAEHQVSRIQPDSEKPLPKAADVLVAAPKEEWTDIVSRNPFSFDRNDVTLVVTPPAAAPPKRPKPILFGTMQLGSDRVAMLAPGDAANRTSRPVRVGEAIDGWTLEDIQEKSVTVRWEETKESVIMNDPTAQIARDYAKTAGTNDTPSSSSAVNALAAAATPANSATAQSPSNTNPPPSNSGRKQILVHTPFGDKVMDDPSQP